MRSTDLAGLDTNRFGRDKRCMSPEQCRAARGWLRWSQQKLADQAKVALSTLKDFENRARKPIPNNLDAIKRALELAGSEFTDGDVPGVRLRKKKR